MRRHLIWALLLVLATVGVAQAQETTSGSLTGVVTDAQGGVVPGATVSIVSGQGTKTFVTDSNGRFFAPFLTPGRYNVKVELSGFTPIEQQGIDVRLGQRLELSGLVLKVGLAETVVVEGAAPTVDTSSTTVGGTLDTEAMRRIPVGRNFTDTLYLVPGVSSSGVGSANPSVSGASGLENNYVVDGVNITNTGYGAVGSYSIVFGSLGTGVTTDFIKETQVKTAGFEAEYGQSTGGVINVVTQSGTNAFHGSLFGYFRPEALEADFRQLTSPRGSINIVGRENTDFGITLGGPVVKDKLFFFGAFNPQFQRVTFQPPTNVSATTGLPTFLLARDANFRDGVDRKREIYSYAGKLTWQATTNHRIDVSAFGDPASGELGPQRFTALANQSALVNGVPPAFSELSKYGGHNQVLKYDGIMSRNWLIEASVARATNTIEEIPAVNAHAVTDNRVTPSVTTGGIGFYEQGNEGTNLQFQLKSTNIFDAAGNHQIRYGVLFEDIEYSNLNNRTGPTFTLHNGVQTSSGASITILPDAQFGQIFRVTRANYINERKTTQKYLSLFLQDTWQVNSKLTLRPGVRYERQRLVGSEEFPLCHEDDSLPGAGDGVGAATACEFTFDNNWGPRLGATYDFRGNGKSKLFASWGRFYAKIPNDLAARALSADAGVTRADYFDAALTRPIANGVSAAGATTHFTLAGVHAAIVDPESKSTYQDEGLVGFEFEAARNLAFGVRYIRRTMPQILEDIGQAAQVLYECNGDTTGPCAGLPGGYSLDSVEYFITNPREGFPSTTANVGSFEDPEHKYQAFEVTANRAFADNWSMLASYRWSKLEGNFEGFFRNDNGQSDPAISSLFDFPTNDPTYTAQGRNFGFEGDIRYLGCSLGCGRLPNDRTHQVKLYANRAFGNLNLGVGYQGSSGQPLTSLFANPVYTSAGEIPGTERGGGIATITNFAEGGGTATPAASATTEFRETSPFEHTVDAHVDYTVRFGERRINLAVDVFNVLDRQEPTNYDNYVDLGFGVPPIRNVNFGYPSNGGAARSTSFQTPRTIRFGARFEW